MPAHSGRCVGGKVHMQHASAKIMLQWKWGICTTCDKGGNFCSIKKKKRKINYPSFWYAVSDNQCYALCIRERESVCLDTWLEWQAKSFYWLQLLWNLRQIAILGYVEESNDTILSFSLAVSPSFSLIISKHPWFRDFVTCAVTLWYRSLSLGKSQDSPFKEAVTWNLGTTTDSWSHRWNVVI